LGRRNREKKGGVRVARGKFKLRMGKAVMPRVRTKETETGPWQLGKRGPTGTPAAREKEEGRGPSHDKERFRTPGTSGLSKEGGQTDLASDRGGEIWWRWRKKKRRRRNSDADSGLSETNLGKVKPRWKAQQAAAEERVNGTNKRGFGEGGGI